MHGFRLSVVVKNLFRVTEWVFHYLRQTRSDHQELFSLYTNRIPRTYYPFFVEIRSALCSPKQVYNQIPLPSGIGLATALFTFLLLPLMPLHPMIIPAVFGASISLAFMTLFLPAWIIRIYRGGTRAVSPD
jgi:hypothetical protein